MLVFNTCVSLTFLSCNSYMYLNYLFIFYLLCDIYSWSLVLSSWNQHFLQVFLGFYWTSLETVLNKVQYPFLCPLGEIFLRGRCNGRPTTTSGKASYQEWYDPVIFHFLGLISLCVCVCTRVLASCGFDCFNRTPMAFVTTPLSLSDEKNI